MRLEKCWFCSSTIYPGHGICFVRNDSKVFRFCRSKCHKNFKLKRNPRKVRWTKAYRALHGKDLTGDTTFEFERRRNRPERYDRNLVGTTLKVMKRVAEVREKRAEKFYEARMKGKEGRERAAARAQLENEIHLVRAPASLRNAAAEEVEEEAMQVEEQEAPVAAKTRAPRVRAPKQKVPASERMRE